jgi:hypothetical protein
VNATFAIAATPMPQADSSTICARRQVTTDPVPRRRPAIALTNTQAASSLAKRPYDLRHACVSTWLKAGAEPKRVAEWAGHSVTVLPRIYTHCLDGGEHEALRRIQKAPADTGDQPKTPRSTSGHILGEQSLAPSDGNGQSPSLTNSDD